VASGLTLRTKIFAIVAAILLAFSEMFQALDGAGACLEVTIFRPVSQLFKKFVKNSL